MNFKEFNLEPKLLEGIDAIGFENATPIQEQVIPLILAGKDLIASAQTGTGKTAAFLLPIIHKIITAVQDDHIQALIIVPTRELALQIAQQLDGLSYFTPLSSIAIYGGGDGSSFETEKKALSHGADIVICTPGKMLSHLNMGYVQVKELKYLILDEADRMLDMGFNEDIMRIISFLPKKRQNLLFSATMPHKMRLLARQILQHPEEINISVSMPAENITQEAFIVYDAQKIPLVNYLLKEKNFPSVLIFCSTKDNVKQLTRELKRSRFSVAEIHSDLEQTEREKVLSGFINKHVSVLVATDVLSRGIDIQDIDLVINYDVPHDGEDYIHRIGRTARAKSKGEAITFVNQKEQSKFLQIENLLGKPIAKAIVPAQLGETPAYDPTSHKKSGGRKKFGNKNKKKPNN